MDVCPWGGTVINNRDKQWLQAAQVIADLSKDESTKVGCIIVSSENNGISYGFNGLPEGVRGSPISRWWIRPAKYAWVEHAERNAVYLAARAGVSTLGATAYMNYYPTPCADCARAFIQAGIWEIVGPDRPFDGKSKDTHYHPGIANTMLREAGVIQRVYRGKY